VQRSMSSRTGLWNLAPGIPVATTSTGTATARPSTAVVKYQRLLRSCLPSQLRVVGHLLTDGMNPLRGRKLPACLHAKLDTTARKPECAAYPAQMLKLRRTHEFSRPSIPPVRGFTDGHRQTQTTVQQPSRRTARSRCRTAFDLAGWYTPGPRPATPGRRSSSDTLTPTAARRCSTGCLSCARATSSPSPAPTAHRYALSSSAPSSIQGPVPDRRRLLPHPDAHSAAGDLRRGIRPRHGHYRSNVIFFATMAP
jgi:hypothetical protein